LLNLKIFSLNKIVILHFLKFLLDLVVFAK
jgi:hypothetical protein